MHAPRAAVPLCTIATIPRQPQHCIEWAHQIAWQEKRKDEPFDSDNMEHISWIYSAALERSRQFSIPGVTFQMAQGVVKNIIPAIASTNAIIAASTTSEALKIATSHSMLSRSRIVQFAGISRGKLWWTLGRVSNLSLRALESSQKHS
jgi:ubiquitin-activating enzyme E1 C